MASHSGDWQFHGGAANRGQARSEKREPLSAAGRGVAAGSAKKSEARLSFGTNSG